jgi:AcrR family transcriptional regulator
LHPRNGYRHPVADDPVLAAVARLLERDGLAGLTISAIAEEAGISRVTLHRRGARVEDLVVAVVALALDDVRASLWPVLTAPDDAATRLETAAGILCQVVERHSGVLSSLFRAPTRGGQDDAFAEPFERLLRDGTVDGTLRSDDPVSDATLLVNAVTWTYLHLRIAHGWSQRRAADHVVDLTVGRHVTPTT